MTDDTTLAQALRAAAAELRGQHPPPELQGRIRAALAPPAAARRPRRAVWVWSGAGAFAMVLLGSALLVLRPAAPLMVDDGLRFGAFIRVAPDDHWPAGDTTAWLVRTELPGERLAALGLPYDPTRAGDSVRADLLMHPSGEVLAVRFAP